MTARKLVYWLLVLSPGLVLAAIGMEARLTRQTLLPSDFAEPYGRRISAYRRIVQASNRCLEDPDATADQREQLAIMWIEGWSSGVFRPLYNFLSTDSMRDGRRGDVFEAQHGLVAALDRDARASAPGDAARKWTISLLLSEIVKYSDLEATASCADMQRRAVEHLEALTPRLQPEECAQLLQYLEQIQGMQREISPLVQLTFRHYETSLVCNEENETIGEGAMSAVAKIRSSRSLRAAIGALDAAMLAQASRSDITFLGSVRTALLYQYKFIDRLHNIAEKLRSEHPNLLARL
jgi:hypothetical protein